MPYGHDPSRYTKQYGYIAQAGSKLASNISQIPETIRSEEEWKMKKADWERKNRLLNEAEAAAKKDWKQLEKESKALRSTYEKYADVLIENNLMTPQEKTQGLAMLRSPLMADKKDPRNYIQNLGTNFATLYDKANSLVKENNLAGQIRQAIYGDVSQQQPELSPEQQRTTTIPEGPERHIPVREPQEIAMGGGGQPLAAPQKQVEQPGGYTEQDIVEAPAPVIPQKPLQTTQTQQPLQQSPQLPIKEEAFGKTKIGTTTEEFEKYGGKYLQSKKDMDYLEALKQKNAQAWTKVRQGDADDFRVENQNLWNRTNDWKNYVEKKKGSMDETTNEIGSNDEAIVRLTQELEAQDPATFTTEEESKSYEETRKKIEELKSQNGKLNDKLLKYQRELIDDEEMLEQSQRAYDYHTQRGKAGMFAEAVKYGKGEAEKEKKAKPVVIGPKTKPKQRGNLPPKTVEDTAIGTVNLPGSSKPQYISTYNSEEDARKAGKKAGDIIRIRGVGKVRLK